MLAVQLASRSRPLYCPRIPELTDDVKVPNPLDYPPIISDPKDINPILYYQKPISNIWSFINSAVSLGLSYLTFPSITSSSASSSTSIDASSSTSSVTSNSFSDDSKNDVSSEPVVSTSASEPYLNHSSSGSIKATAQKTFDFGELSKLLSPPKQTSIISNASNFYKARPLIDLSTFFAPRPARPGVWIEKASTIASPALSRAGSILEQDSVEVSQEELTVNSIDTTTPCLTLDMIKQAMRRFKDDEDLSALSFLRAAFSRLDILAESFAGDGSTTCHPSGLNLDHVREAYSCLLEKNEVESIQTIISDAQEILLSNLLRNPRLLSKRRQQDLRVLFIVAENPLLGQPKYEESLLKKFLRLMGVGMDDQDRKLMIIWLSSFDPSSLERLVNLAKSYLSDHIVPSNLAESVVKATVRFLKNLYLANEYQHPAVLPMSVFYLEDLNKKLTFKDEYKHWISISNEKSIKKNVPSFSYFNYPFLLDCLAKSRIMHIDAIMQMANQFEDAFVFQALVVHATRFLPEATSVNVLGKEKENASIPYLVLELRRSRLVEDVLDQLTVKQADIKKPLKVKFVDGEEGHDAGGVQKEFFQIIIAELLDPIYGMFIYDMDSRYSWINGVSLESDGRFELCGMIIGLALYNGVILDVNFPPLLWKKLVGEKLSVEDMKIAFPSLGRGLEQLLTWTDGDVEDVFLRTFEISYDVYGQVKTYPLIDGGPEIMVNNENREEYVRAYIKHYTEDFVRRPFQALKRGFLKVCDGSALKMCRSKELELMICGNTASELNFYELESATAYDDGYSPLHPVIIWFWEIVNDLSLERKRKLLHFVTASDRVPLKGLGTLTFVIQRNGPDSERLPSSLTCFGRLLLPEYSSREKLENRLITAIENSRGFGLV